MRERECGETWANISRLILGCHLSGPLNVSELAWTDFPRDVGTGAADDHLTPNMLSKYGVARQSKSNQQHLNDKRFITYLIALQQEWLEGRLSEILVSDLTVGSKCATVLSITQSTLDQHRPTLDVYVAYINTLGYCNRK